MIRYLTKSRFKLALSCPTKLYYTGKDIYPDEKKDDPFLETLAEGGYQVGELAKCYFPNGHEIVERGYNIPLNKTAELIKKKNVTIYEAAFSYKNLFVRVDIIEKKSDVINLFEVKAKSFDGTDSDAMLNKKGYLDSGWHDYVYDVAFQKYVISQSNPKWKVYAHLMLANKNAIATVDGLNQKFQLKKVEGERVQVKQIGDVSKKNLGQEILIQINVDEIIDRIYDGSDSNKRPKRVFVDNIHFLADNYEKNQKIITKINKDCQKCEFHATGEEEKNDKKSGFKECWSEQLGWNDSHFNQPLIFEIWNFKKKQELLDNKVYFLKDVKENDIGNTSPNTDGSLSTKQRQWIQIKKFKNNDPKPYVDKKGLRIELESFTFPLHFIDFETSMVAIPFYKGRRPCEQTAFQFSHHIVHDDGTINHQGQYLCTEKGKFPNFEFADNLMKELEEDNGTIFRYAEHENTVLNQILVQLQGVSGSEVKNKNTLIEFIRSITHHENHHGERNMVDLLNLVKKYYYHPMMNGSNSIKSVLPAVLNSSEYIKDKYAKPIYGVNSPIKSLNYNDGWIWIQKDSDENIISPYKLLPPLFEDLNEEEIEEFFMGDKLADGGAAITAYAKMQFTQITDVERDRIIKGLYKYCELDTMAMVFIWEYWNSIIKR